MHIEEILPKLKKVTKSGGQYKACCPAHDDKDPSLSIAEKDGNILLKCHAECSTEEICSALGITTKDLFNDNKPLNPPKKQTKQFDREHIYTDESGSIVAKKKIYRLSSGGKTAFWERYENNKYTNGLNGIEPPLYHLSRVVKELETVYITEGEKDTETVEKMGYTATTIPNKKWLPEHKKHLTNKNVIIIRDIDESGEKQANKAAAELFKIAKTVKIINPATMCEGLPKNGDISDVVSIIGLDKAKEALIKLVLDTPIITQTEEKSNLETDETPTKKPPFTIEALEDYLKGKNIKYRLNEITHKIDIEGMESENKEQIQANIYAILFSELQCLFNKSCTQNNIRDYLAVLASRNCYNPILDDLEKITWDEKDRITELYEIMEIPEDDGLSKTLIFKWLWQCLSMLHNNPDEPFGADGCLVLQGEQGIGKTTLFRTLAMEQKYFKSGTSIEFRDKDTYIRALSCWIAELGEIESTFKSDVERLKAFITQEQDEFRRPYGRGDETPLRRTSLCGTCNSTEFLLDTTGNRRWWTVPVNNINLEKLKKLNVPQLWKQIQVYVELDLQGFRLTPEERAELNKRNTQHEKKLKGQQEIEDILGQSDTNSYSVVWEYMTVTDFRNCYSEELRYYKAEQIGKVLDKLGIKSKSMRINGSSYPSKVRLLPRIKYNG